MTPDVSPALANAAAVSFTVIYVAGFYLFSQWRRQPFKMNRNHPVVITARIKAVSLASLITIALVRLILPQPASVITALGLAIPLHWTSIHLLRPVLLTIILFLGPLSQMYIGNTQGIFALEQFEYKLKAFRDYFVAPFTEELVFRASVIAVLYQAHYSKSVLIFVSPLYFGIAHLHHMWENYHTYGANKDALIRAALQSVFQMAYTTVFGWYASFVFMRMNSVWSAALCHAFCNIMGFPDPSSIEDCTRVQRRVIYICYILGLISFVTLLYQLTDPASVGGSFYWP